MPTIKNTALGFVIASIAASTALAQPFNPYGEESGWNILVNEAFDNGCLIEKVMDDGLQVQIGVDPRDERGYVAIYVQAEKGVEDGMSVPVMFDLDGDKFSGDATGGVIDGYQGGYVYFNNPKFALDLAQKQTLTVTPEGRDATVVDLTGSKKAMQAMIACQQAQ